MDAPKTNTIQKANISHEGIMEISSDIQYFFVNYSEDEAKKNLWKLFTGWTYNTSAGGGSSEIADMLLFYEHILDIVELLATLSNYE
jgi:hypothetical protein